MSAHWWIGFTLLAAGAQTLRNAMQRSLTERLGTIGATHVRFLFGLPFALVFLLAVAHWAGGELPVTHAGFWAWVMLGGMTQILGTGLMLAVMKERSFVVTTAYVKTEPIQVALFALVFLGDRLTLPLVIAIVLATTGVLLMSLPKAAPAAANITIGAATSAASGDVAAAATSGLLRYRAALLGIAAGAMFALAATGFRGAILSLPQGSFVTKATLTLACGQLIQTILLTSYLLLRSPATLAEIFRAWRPSMLAGFMGAFASQMWFLAFALETAAKVRTLALIEILFAQALSHKLLAQGSHWRELLGIALVVVGVGLLLNG